MTDVDRRDEIEEELAALDLREEQIVRRLHELVPGAARSDGPLIIESYAGDAGKRQNDEWHELIAEQISLHSRRHTLYSEFSALTTTEVNKNG